jgi:antitoxin component YwqK of YwqJK toxin-antitoxin module
MIRSYLIFILIVCTSISLRGQSTIYYDAVDSVEIDTLTFFNEISIKYFQDSSLLKEEIRTFTNTIIEEYYLVGNVVLNLKYDDTGTLLKSIEYNDSDSTSFRQVFNLRTNSLHSHETQFPLSNGKKVFFYQNGEVKREESYRRGLLNGLATEYYETGEILSEQRFKDGVKIGTELRYFENGVLSGSLQYADGKMHGFHFIYNSNGELTTVGLYEYGELLFTTDKFDPKYDKKWYKKWKKIIG